MGNTLILLLYIYNLDIICRFVVWVFIKALQMSDTGLLGFHHGKEHLKLECEGEFGKNIVYKY